MFSEVIKDEYIYVLCVYSSNHILYTTVYSTNPLTNPCYSFVVDPHLEHINALISFDSG